MQNSNPVASQFRADPKPKITSPRPKENANDPFSPSFKRLLQAQGGNLRKVNDAIANGGRATPPTPSSQPLHEGCVIEHQRFGIGTVIKVEGSGDENQSNSVIPERGNQAIAPQVCSIYHCQLTNSQHHIFHSHFILAIAANPFAYSRKPFWL
jgi:hypothetical protein